ncbi:MAG: hypothetical protein JXQ72_09245 [Anaerolineae bacterium]|nr:hypothetical protein [Anaerolineae bacterium]
MVILRRVVGVGLVLSIGLLLAACGGGEEQQGVDLEVAEGARPTETPTPVPTDAPAVEGEGEPLSGRLVYLKGQGFEMLDLASGEVTTFTDLRQARGQAPIVSYSPVNFNANDSTRGLFVAFPDIGTMDLETNEINAIPTNGTFVNQLGISPDGEWFFVVMGGGYITRLAVFSFDGSQSYSIGASSSVFYQGQWTLDSRFIWFEIPQDGAADGAGGDAAEVEPPLLMLLDLATGESAPLGADEVYEVFQGNLYLVSPDGSRFANVPIGFGADAAPDDPDACFDSFVELYDHPFTTADQNPQSEVIYTEAGLVASSPQWLDDDRLLFVRLGEGTCGEVEGEPERQIMLLDLTADPPQPVAVAGPIGSADDPNARDGGGRFLSPLYSPSPDGEYIAWVDGGRQAGETLIRVTHVASGTTQTVVRFSETEFADSASYIENGLLRQVQWLE